ncbi:MAG: site-specific integrase [Deltaproteobacteria bacterium]|jgi:integrase|nr:site-specific integrase [Deltaproteobacteria bacterium]
MSRRKKTSYPGVFYRESKRIGGKGTEKVYYIVFKKDGKVYEEKAGRQYADDMTPARTARIRAERIEGKRLSRKEIRQQRDEKKTAEANKWTLDRLFNEYMSTRPGNKSKTTDQNRYENHLQPVFGNTEPCKIDPLSVDRLRIKLLKKLSPQTVKHVLNLFTWTVNFGVKKNLCKGLSFHVQKPSVSNAKTEDLTPEQLKRLIDAIDKDENIQAQNLMRMALYTGMRRGELFKLKWRDIDSPHGFICIRDPKGGVDQTIPLNDAAREVLRNHIKTDSPFVFPGRNGQERKAISKQVNRIKKRAGLPKDFRPLHGLRHVFASMLASSGKVDMYTLQKLLTHKDPRMTQRYAHLRDETLKKASNLAGDIINQVVQQNDNVVGFENVKKKG